MLGTQLGAGGLRAAARSGHRKGQSRHTGWGGSWAAPGRRSAQARGSSREDDAHEAGAWGTARAWPRGRGLGRSRRDGGRSRSRDRARAWGCCKLSRSIRASPRWGWKGSGDEQRLLKAANPPPGTSPRRASPLPPASLCPGAPTEPSSGSARRPAGAQVQAANARGTCQPRRVLTQPVLSAQLGTRGPDLLPPIPCTPGMSPVVSLQAPAPPARVPEPSQPRRQRHELGLPGACLTLSKKGRILMAMWRSMDWMSLSST